MYCLLKFGNTNANSENLGKRNKNRNNKKRRIECVTLPFWIVIVQFLKQAMQIPQLIPHY